jgi:hypothetical protein
MLRFSGYTVDIGRGYQRTPRNLRPQRTYITDRPQQLQQQPLLPQPIHYKNLYLTGKLIQYYHSLKFRYLRNAGYVGWHRHGHPCMEIRSRPQTQRVSI